MSDDLEKVDEVAKEENDKTEAATPPPGDNRSPAADPAAAATTTAPPAPEAPAPGSDGAEAADAAKMFGGKSEEPPATSTPVDGSGAKLRDPSDDITSQIGSHIEKSQTDSDALDAHKMFGGETPAADAIPGATAQPTAPKPKEKVDEKTLPTRMLLDVLNGAASPTSEIAGGVLDAFHAGIGLGKVIDTFAQKHFPNLPGMAGFAEQALHNAVNVDEEHPLDKVIAEPTSVTGKAIRGMSQFVTGFMATGVAGEAVGAVGVLPHAIESAVKFAVTDYSFFEGKAQNLANLIESNPKLSNFITQNLQTNPDDPELLNRAKNAGLGLVSGVASDALIKGFSSAVKFMWQAGGSAAYGKIVAKWMGNDVSTAANHVQPFEVSTLGDPEGDFLVNKKIQDAADATAGIKPSEVTGQGPGYDYNFAKVSTSDDVKQMMGMAASREDARIAAGGSARQSVAQTNAKAGQIDAFDLLLNRREGQALNASQLQSARGMYAASGEKLAEMARNAAQYPTEANLYMFERMSQVHSLVQKEVINASSEAGRALNILRQPVGASGEMAQQISDALEKMGGSGGSLDKANKVLKLLASPAGQGGVDSFVKGTFGKSVKDAIDQAYINGRFGQKTLVVKTVSDFANMGRQMLIRRNAEFISQKLGTEGGVAAGEAMAMAHGWVSANKMFLTHLGDSLKDVSKDVMSGESGVAEGLSDAVSAPRNALDKVPGIPFELPPTGKISADNFNVANDSFLGKMLNTYNGYTQLWGKGIGLVDQYSKMVGYHMELHAQALRKASQEMPEGMESDPEAFHNRIAELVANPPADLHLASVNQATYQTFTTEPEKWMNDMGTAIQNIPGIGRMLLPFKATPINILTQAMEGSPLAPLVSSWRADLAAGGARADIAMSKMATGTALFQVYLDAAMKGMITGKGPDHPAERANWERLGNQPYSFKSGDGHMLAYNRLEPESYAMGAAADFAAMLKLADNTVDDKTFLKVLAGNIFTIANSIGSKTYLESAIAAVKAFTGTEEEHEKWLKQQIGSIPATVAGSPITTLQQISDPVARTTETMTDALYKKIPGLSKSLAAQRNRWGETLDRSSDLGAGYDAISPYWLKTAHPQEIDKELDRLKYFPDMPPHTIRDGGKIVQLDAHQYDRLTELAGNALKDPARGNLGMKDFLNQMVQGKGAYGSIYKMLGTLDAQDGGDRQRTEIKTQIRSYDELARKKIVSEDGNLQSSIDAKHAHDKIKQAPIKQRIFSTGTELKGD